MRWLLALAAADLPTHCLLGDAAGEWVFQLSPPSDTLNACGHTAPNSVSSMLAINRSALVVGGETVRITLTEEIEGGAEVEYAKPGMGLLRHERSGRRMVARDEHGEVGSWTMIFDTGFEVRVGGRSVMVGFDFRTLDGLEGATPKTGDVWDKIAFYEGRHNRTVPGSEGGLYVCECDSTSGGWANLAGGKHACAIADKAEKPKAAKSFVASGKDGALRKFRADVLDKDYVAPAARPAKTEAVVRKAAPVAAPAAAGPVAKGTPDAAAKAAKGAPDAAAAKATKSLRGASAKGGLPASFDWRDELKLMDGFDVLGEEMDQGACGSCWAFTSTAVFQSRLRIGLYKKYGSLVPVSLDWTDTFACNPYGEGCSGGWNLQAARFLQDFGIPELQAPTTPQDKVEACNWQRLNTSDKVYARDYGYVGGFSHGATEQALMDEVFAFGPVAASINTNAIEDFWNGNYGKVISTFNNADMPKETFSSNDEVGDWFYTTHAVVLVGWGESQDEPPVPYWVVRNSWGPGWGDHGYGYVRRGRNDAALEASAVWIDPDLDRLPASFKRKAHSSLTRFGTAEAAA